MSIIRLKKKDSIYYKVIGIPIRVADSVQQGKKIDVDKLTDYIQTKFTTEKTSKKTGKVTRKVEWFELVVPKVLYGQQIIDGGQPFMLGSSTLPYNNVELHLTKEAIKAIEGKKSVLALSEVYDEIVIALNKYLPLYDINQFRVKLTNAKEKFTAFPDQNVMKNGKLITVGQHTLIDRMLIGLHTNSTYLGLKELGIATPLGFMQQQRGIKLSEDAVVKFLSPTGLFERRIQLKDL